MSKRFKVQNLSKDLARTTSRATSTSARLTPNSSASRINSQRSKNSELASDKSGKDDTLASSSNSSLSSSSLDEELLRLGEDFSFFPRNTRCVKRFNFLSPSFRELGYDAGQDLKCLRSHEAGDIIGTLRECYEKKGSVQGIVAEIDWVRMRNQLRKGLRNNAGVS